jgi:hypothetical protein
MSADIRFLGFLFVRPIFTSLPVNFTNENLRRLPFLRIRGHIEITPPSRSLKRARRQSKVSTTFSTNPEILENTALFIEQKSTGFGALQRLSDPVLAWFERHKN